MLAHWGREVNVVLRLGHNIIASETHCYSNWRRSLLKTNCGNSKLTRDSGRNLKEMGTASKQFSVSSLGYRNLIDHGAN